jgi:hypothetical protein
MPTLPLLSQQQPAENCESEATSSLSEIQWHGRLWGNHVPSSVVEDSWRPQFGHAYTFSGNLDAGFA